LSKADVIPLKGRDSALEEEARTAARIVENVKAGEERAKTELVNRYSPGLLRILKRRLGDDERARDCLHDTFCIAFQKLDSEELESPERLAGYLRGIAVRVAFNSMRKRVREPVPVETEIVTAILDVQPSQFERISANEVAEVVRTLLDAMPVARDRELLLRLYVYDQDREEICRELGMDRLHFNRVLYRAKNRFRKLLESAETGSDFSM
jgi:RNA polymerase sigma-70 factor (ECF subfamily)